MHGAKIAMESMNLLCNDVKSDAGDSRGLHGRRGEFGQRKTMDDMGRDRAEKSAKSSEQLVNSMVLSSLGIYKNSRYERYLVLLCSTFIRIYS
jgi:hypothetical protein